MFRLRIQVAHWPRRCLVLTDTPRPDCRNCDGAGGIPHDYGHPETGEYDGTDWEPCDCWTQWRMVLLPLPRWLRRTPPGAYSDEPPFQPLSRRDVIEIRIICDPGDADRVTTALNGAFTIGAVRDYPTRDGKHRRLYVTADHRPELGPWPTPEEAYALAPSIIREIGWTAQTAADKPFGQDLGREFWLRKAALLDRIAVRDEEDGVTGDATEVATEAAQRLIAYDRDGAGDYYGAPYWPEHPASAADPRGYVRQEYAHWTKNH